MPSSHRNAVAAASRPRAKLALVAIVWLLLAATCSPAAASPATDECAGAVVRDWYDNGRIDDSYPLACYSAAIEELPPDVRDYSSASDEIRRALTVAANRPAAAGAEQQASGVPSGGLGSPNSVPLPVLLLGAVTIVVLAAGAAGFVARRLRGDSGPPSA